jgi:hypothetical protein
MEDRTHKKRTMSSFSSLAMSLQCPLLVKPVSKTKAQKKLPRLAPESKRRAKCGVRDETK